MAHRLEIVQWRDANFSTDGKDIADDLDGDYICATVGWTRDTERWVIVIGELTPGGERAVTRIPRENIINRKRLKIRKNKDGVQQLWQISQNRRG